MKLTKTISLFAALIWTVSSPTQAQVVINEVMAQNNSTITDPDYGKSADWVELYNTGAATVDLGGYGITDNLDSPTKYTLPEGTKIAAGGYLLIWCDGNSSGLHTSFKLSADGESVGLYTPQQELADSISFGVQLLDISYGRLQDNTKDWVFFPMPTPGKANGNDGYAGKANQPMILTPGGLFSGSVTVEITNDLGGAVHYTTDGSEPTAASPIYTGPLTFTSTTVLRARIIEDGKIPGNVMTESYFVDEAFAGHKLPVVSIVTDDDNFWGSANGIYVQNFKPDWEIPVNIEMFLNNGSDRSAFNERAGIKINGLYSWQLPQKMLGVYFKKKYGESKLEYQLFFDDSRSSFDDFALRASGSDWSYTLMRDGLVQQAARKGNMNLDLMAFRPCVVYVNGKFLGIHNIREKVDDDYIKQHYGLGSSEYDMVEGSANEPEVGTADAWVDFFTKAKSTDLSNDANFAQFADSFDVENFTDYIISESYSENTSLEHNTMVWKTHNGGKWRWILMDTDRGFFDYGNSTYYPISFVTGKTYWPLKWMMNNSGYKSYFCKRLADQLFTTYNPDEICRQIDEHQADIEPLIDKHVARWLGTTSSYGDAIPSVAYWYNEVDNLRDFAHGRVAVLLSDLTNYGVSQSALLALSSQPDEACTLSFNGHTLPQTHWGGMYPMQSDITLTAKGRAGYNFIGWKKTTLTDIIEKGSTWSYLDDGSNQGTAWISNDFDDSTWKTGGAPLGYKLSDIKTTINKHITNYFRKHFTFTKSDNIKSVKLKFRREDAGMLYLNGKLIVNSDLQTEGTTYTTLSNNTMSDIVGKLYFTYDISVDDLRDGDNVIAAEVHQCSSSSSDCGFDVQLQVETLDADAELVSPYSLLTLKLTADEGLCAVYEPTGENVLPETIDSDITLYKNQSPYIVNKDVTVTEKARITIEPGVTLLFSPDTKMIVNGTMTADGTATDSIMFRLNPKYDDSESWGALCFINTGDRVSSISYAEFRDASRGPKEYNCVAAVSGYKTILRLDHIRITDTDANPVACRYSDVRVTNSIFHEEITGDGVNIKYGKGYVADCEFIGNGYPDTDAIDYDGVSGGVIRRCIVHDFSGSNSDAIDLGEQAMGVTIDSVLVSDITDKGISVGQRSTARVTNSTFIQTNLGLGIKDSCYAEVDKCTFYGVCQPIACYEKVLFRAGGNANVTNCVFSNSYTGDVLCDDKSYVAINNSLSDTSDLPYGSNNVNADPEFTAPALYDLSSSSSLLVDRGADYIPERPDIQPIITELCYLPDETRGETEYITLSNPGTEDIDLEGYTFTQGITYTFPEGIILPAGDQIVVAKDMSAISGQNAVEWENGKLSDKGEAIELATPNGVKIDQVNYLPSAPWPVVNEAGNNVIIMKDPVKGNHIAANWQLKSSTDVSKITHTFDLPELGYDLQGRQIYVKTAHGIIIVDGKKKLVR